MPVNLRYRPLIQEAGNLFGLRSLFRATYKRRFLGSCSRAVFLPTSLAKRTTG